MSTAGYLILTMGFFLLGAILLNNEKKCSISKSEFMTFCNIKTNFISVKKCPDIDKDIISKIKVDCPEYYVNIIGLKKSYFRNDSILILDFIFELDSSNKTEVYSGSLILCDSINVYKIDNHHNKIISIFPISSIKNIHITYKKIKR